MTMITFSGPQGQFLAARGKQYRDVGVNVGYRLSTEMLEDAHIGVIRRQSAQTDSSNRAVRLM
jgi:hypothetical protein